HLECVRHSRPAFDVLRAGGNDGPVSLPSLRTVGGADFYRVQNARVALRVHSNRMGTGDRAFCFGSFHPRLAGESAKETGRVELSVRYPKSSGKWITRVARLPR